MRDKELYQNLLEIVSPWSVDSVTMDVEKQRVDVMVSHPSNLLFACPECGTEFPVFDPAEETPGQLSVLHLSSCPDSPDLLSDAWSPAGVGSLGRSPRTVHQAVRAPGDRCPEGVRHFQCGSPSPDQLGRGVGNPGTGGWKGLGPKEGEAAREDRGGRKGHRQGAPLHDAGL